MTNILLYVGVVADNNGSNPVIPTSSVPAIIADVNDIWKQACRRFVIQGVYLITNSSLKEIDGTNKMQLLTSMLNGVNNGTGLELYFTREFVLPFSDAEGMCSPGRGAVTTTFGIQTPKDVISAHELGHSQGLHDIYIGEGAGLFSTPVASTYEPNDWTGQSGYYLPGLTQATLIQRLLMCGDCVSNKRDIPNGTILGYAYGSNNTSQVSVGVSSLWNSPVDQ